MIMKVIHFLAESVQSKAAYLQETNDSDECALLKLPDSVSNHKRIYD